MLAKARARARIHINDSEWLRRDESASDELKMYNDLILIASICSFGVCGLRIAWTQMKIKQKRKNKKIN